MGSVDLKQQTIAVVPGTGRIGSRLAFQLAKNGLSIVVGSQDPAKAQELADQISNETQLNSIKGVSNAEAAAAGDIIVWCPCGPLACREELRKQLASWLKDKIIIDVTNVMNVLDSSSWGQTSSTLLNQKALGVPARWTTAFKSTFYNLSKENPPNVDYPHSTFVAGDDAEAVATTIALMETIPGFKGLKAGALENSKLVELLGPPQQAEL